MERVIYCPSNDLLNDAEILAKEYALPIVIGCNDHIINLNFDKTQIKPLSIPFIFDLHILKLQVELGLTQCITFTDEFNIIKNKIKILNNEEEVPLMWQEMHRIKSTFQTKKLGENEVKILFNDKVVGHGKFNVYRKNYRDAMRFDI